MTRFIFFDPICSQARLLLPLFPFFFKFYLAVFFCHFFLSSHVHPLLPSSTSPHPLSLSSCEGEGEQALGLLSCVLPPGLPSNYCILSFEKKKKELEEGKKRRKWRTRRLRPLVAPSIGFITLPTKMVSFGLGFLFFFKISIKTLLWKTFQAMCCKGSLCHTYFLLYNIKPALRSFAISAVMLQIILPASPSPSTRLISLSHLLSLWQMVLEAIQMGSSKQVNKQAGINIPGD